MKHIGRAANGTALALGYALLGYVGWHFGLLALGEVKRRLP